MEIYNYTARNASKLLAHFDKCNTINIYGRKLHDRYVCNCVRKFRPTRRVVTWKEARSLSAICCANTSHYVLEIFTSLGMPYRCLNFRRLAAPFPYLIVIDYHYHYFRCGLRSLSLKENSPLASNLFAFPIEHSRMHAA